MNNSTTIVNTNNGDRVMKVIISTHNYLAFTIMHCTLIVIEINNFSGNILLYNRNFSNNKELDKAFDKIIIIATKAKDEDEFISNMDTYINLRDINNNETIESINNICNIVLELL